MQKDSLKDLLYASAGASAHFAVSNLEPVNGHLRAKSSFLTPTGEIMHWHEFGDLEGPGWAANAIGGAHLLYQWGTYVEDCEIKEKSLALLDHVLEDGFIDWEEGFIWPYYDLAKERFCWNYVHGTDWFCPGSLAKIGVQLLEFAASISKDPRSVKMEQAAIQLGNYLRSSLMRLPNGWLPRRIRPDGQLFPFKPDGQHDPIFDHSADGLFVLQLYAQLVKRDLGQFHPILVELCQNYIDAGGYFGSINHDTYDDHESVAYACGFLILCEVSEILSRPEWKEFAYQVLLPGLGQFQMDRDYHGLPTRGLLWMEKSWNTAYLWENAEAAHAYLYAWIDRNDPASLERGEQILSAAALHHHGAYGFLTEGVDWDNHVTRRHHIHGALYEDIRYTEPLLNNLHILKPTLYYFQRNQISPPGATTQEAIEFITEVGRQARQIESDRKGVQYFIRFYYPALATDSQLNQALDFLRRCQADGVLLFEASYDLDPALLTLEEIQSRLARIKDILPKFREVVSEVHLNMMITLGHVDAGSGRPERFPFQFMVDEFGNTSRSTACPLDPRFLERISAQYRLAAETEVDLIWVDDDTRYFFHDLPGMTCFCSFHLRAMSDRTGRNWDRETLVAALADEKNEQIRQTWLDLQEESILKLAETIRKAVDALNPNLRIGLMSVGQAIHAAEGRHPDRLLRVLAGKRRPLIRPGSGFWNDQIPKELLTKVEGCARELHFVGSDVQVVAEIENHPYTPFGKSQRILTLELAWNVLVGMKDLSLNILSSVGDPMPLETQGTNYAEFLSHWRPFLNELMKVRNQKYRRGIHIIDHEDYARHCNSGEPLTTRWIQPRPWEIVLANLGFPIGPPGSDELGYEQPAWISGEVIHALSDYDLTWYLRAGAVVDPIAALGLIQRGWGDRLGLQGVKWVGDGVNEVITDDPLNLGCEGNILPVHQILPLDQISTWIVDANHARVLSRWVNVDGKDCGPALTLLEARDPAYSQTFTWRVALLPFALRRPIQALLNLPRRVQWTKMLEWLAGEPLPAKVLEGVNLAPLAFESEDGKEKLITLANLSADDQWCELQIRSLDSHNHQASRFNEDGSWSEITVLEAGKLSLFIPSFSLAAIRVSNRS